MRFRLIAPLALIVMAAACGGVAEGPTSPPSPALAHIGDDIDITFVLDIGEPPPPPLDTLMVDMSGGSASSPYSFAGLTTRYFVNKSGKNAWIMFYDTPTTDASPGARLQYNAAAGKTLGHGTLTDRATGASLDLSGVSFTGGYFGSCNVKGCAALSFTDADDNAGSLLVRYRARRPGDEAIFTGK